MRANSSPAVSTTNLFSPKQHEEVRSRSQKGALAGADLSEADLSGAHFTGARLDGANVFGVNRTDTVWGSSKPRADDKDRVAAEAWAPKMSSQP